LIPIETSVGVAGAESDDDADELDEPLALEDEPPLELPQAARPTMVRAATEATAKVRIDDV
jgi:hypothetical protein